MKKYYPVLLLLDDSHSGNGSADYDLAEKFNKHAVCLQMVVFPTSAQAAIIATKVTPEQVARMSAEYHSLTDLTDHWLRERCGELDVLYGYCHRGEPLCIELDF